MRDAFVQALTEIAACHPQVMLLTGDLGFGALDHFSRSFPRQFVNVGVAEQNMTGLAVGLALEGRVVFTYSIGNFPTLRCLEQIRNDACYHGADVKIVAIGGGMSYGAVGASHHATEDLAILRSLPGMTVVSPGDCWEVREATRALVEHRGTAYLRLDKSSARHVDRPGEVFRLGKARVVADGRDVTLVATGGILGEAMRAAEILRHSGVESRVLSMHTIKPLDTHGLIEAATETAGMVAVEEHTIEGGLGGAIAEALLECGVTPGFFARIGLRSGFSSVVGSQSYLRSVYGLDAEAIASAVMAQARSLDRHRARGRQPAPRKPGSTTRPVTQPLAEDLTNPPPAVEILPPSAELWSRASR
jgi:transketolase